MEAIGSELNLFEPATIQSAVVGEMVQEFGPIATITQGSPIDFQIEGGGQNYIDLNNSKLEVRVKLVGPAPAYAVIDNAIRVGVANLALHSLFSAVTIKIADKVVTESNNLYPYRAMLETLINYPREPLESRMLCEGFIEDTSAHIGTTDPAGGNVGLGAREVLFHESRIVRLIGRLHSDLWHQEKLLPPNVKIDVQLVPNRATFFIKTAIPVAPDRDHPAPAQIEYKFHIVSVRFLVQFKQVSPSMFLAHQNMLEKVNYQIPHTKVSLKTQTIPAGVRSFTIDNLYKGKLPDRIVMAMVNDAAHSGDYHRNPFNFQHFGLNFLVVKVNSEMVPRIPLEPNFAGNDYLREYISVLETLEYDIGPNIWSLTPTSWATGNNIWVFKITPGPIGVVRSSPVVGDIRLEMKFTADTPASITLILLAEEPATLEIDKFGHVFI